MPEQISAYLQHLPAIFNEDPFLGRFLLAFEKVLTGLNDPDHPGVEEYLNHIHRFFIPVGDQQTPEDFLPWLAGWVALSLRDDWQETSKRRFISEAVSLYRLRGTPEGLKRAIAAYTSFPPESITIAELIGKVFTVEVNSTVEDDTIVEGAPPYYFQVRMNVPPTWTGDISIREQLNVRAIIDQEKPAHTVYDLQFETPTMIVEERSTVGVDTILGTN